MLMKRILFVWQACVLLIAATASAQAPISAGPEARSWKDYYEVELAFTLRTALDQYKQTGSRDDRWDQQAERFLTMCANVAGRAAQAPGGPEVLAAGRAAIEAGCDDPMVAYFYGRTLRTSGDLGLAQLHLRKAYDGFEGTEYSVSYRSWAASHLSLVLKAIEEEAESKRYDALSRQHLIETITSGNYRPEERRNLYSHARWTVNNTPLGYLQEIHNAVVGHEGADPWMAKMIAGRFQVRLAWQARGDGWANTVTAEAWKAFREHLTKARAAYTAAWQLDKEAPESAAAMIDVAMGGGELPGEGIRFWFDRAVAAQFDYMPAYKNMNWALMPRWGGSHEAVYAFGRECLATGRFDTQVPYQLMVGVQSIVGDQGGSVEFLKQEGVYDDLRAMVNGYLKEPSAEADRDRYRSLGAAIAWRSGKWNEARQFLDDLNSPSDDAAFAQVGSSVEQAVSEIYARSGDLEEPMQEADDLVVGGDYVQAIVIYHDLISRKQDDQRVVTYIRERLQHAEIWQTLKAGQWFDLLPTEGLEGWRVKSGDWSVNNEGVLVGASGKDGLILENKADFGVRYELRGTARFVTSPFAKFNIGVYFGRKNGEMENSFRFYEVEHIASLFRSQDEIGLIELPVHKVNTLRVLRWDDMLYTFLNDIPTQQGVGIAGMEDLSDTTIGIGGWYWYDGVVIQFEELKIRLLEEQPVPMTKNKPTGDARTTDAGVENLEGDAEPEGSEGDRLIDAFIKNFMDSNSPDKK